MTDLNAFDARVPHPARIYNYWLGGKDNFAADRVAAEQAMAVNPMVVAGVRANRGFLGRAVRYLAAEAGIRQFLDIGTGLPTADNTHEVAQRVTPESKIVYVDNDPIVLLHANALLTSTPSGRTAYVECDLRDTAKVLSQAAEVLDFDEPVALMMLAVLQLIPDDDDPYAIVASLLDPLAPGSYLTLSHPASDVHVDEMAEMARGLNEQMAQQSQSRIPAYQMKLRSRAEVLRFFTGLDLLEPGLVQPALWRPMEAFPQPASSGWAGVAQKTGANYASR
jgi:hypothetical protein